MYCFISSKKPIFQDKQYTKHNTTHFSTYFVDKSLFCKSNSTNFNGITVCRKSTMLLKFMGKKPRGSWEMVSRKHLYIQTHSLITVNLFTDIRSLQSTTGGRQNCWRRSLYLSASWCNKTAMRVWKRYIDRQRHWSSAMFLSTVRYSKVSDILTTLLNAFSF